MHNGNSDLFKNTGNANARVIISKFELMLPKGESSNPGELLMRLATWKDDKTNEEYYTIKMNIRNIIDEIYYAVLEFYENWPTKNDFEDHSIRFLNYEETLKETY